MLRFIEYMDVGTTNGWRLEDVVPADEMLETISPAGRWSRWRPPMPARWPAVTAIWTAAGEIGVIASVTRPFCRGCTRARLSADGRLYTCLFAADGHDLRAPLREGVSDGELSELVAGIWVRRRDRYSELRSAETSRAPRVEMSRIGG